MFDFIRTFLFVYFRFVDSAVSIIVCPHSQIAVGAFVGVEEYGVAIVLYLEVGKVPGIVTKDL